MLAARIVRYRALFWADATDHAKGFAFLTVVAGTNVLAAASIVVHDWWGLGHMLWWIGAVGWVVTLYPTLVAVVVIVPEHPTLTKGINGSWFLLTVSTQSIAVTAGLLLTRASPAPTSSSPLPAAPLLPPPPVPALIVSPELPRSSKAWSSPPGPLLRSGSP